MRSALTEVSPAKVSPAKVSLEEVSPEEVSLEEVSLAEVGLYEIMLVPPLIPAFYPLLQECKVFFVRHKPPLRASSVTERERKSKGGMSDNEHSVKTESAKTERNQS